MLKSVIYMHRFQLNDARDLCTRRTQSSWSWLHAPWQWRVQVEPTEEENGGVGTQIRAGRLNVSRPQVKQTIKACKTKRKENEKRRTKNGKRKTKK